jgi:hypothetical protein
MENLIILIFKKIKAKLRKEKVDLIAFCKKQQTKLIHIEKQMSEQSEETRKKQAQIDTLQYEMNSQSRRFGTEINNLKQVVANLELELNTTRREADEYHKATIEKNSEISSLETKISELKIKLSMSGTQLNFGAQELFIQQLQDEIKRLSALNQQSQIKIREQQHHLMREVQFASSTTNNKDNKTNYISSKSCSESDKQKNNSFLNKKIKNDNANQFEAKSENEKLRIKLKTAAKFINSLIQEKEHLIEMSNQLRGELNRIKRKKDLRFI